jgi:hypothetical protein
MKPALSPVTALLLSLLTILQGPGRDVDRAEGRRNGPEPDGYFILATSDDGGGTWSQPRLVVGALDPSGKRQRGALVGNLWTDPRGRLWLFFDQTVIGTAASSQRSGSE